MNVYMPEILSRADSSSTRRVALRLLAEQIRARFGGELQSTTLAGRWHSHRQSVEGEPLYVEYFEPERLVSLEAVED